MHRRAASRELRVDSPFNKIGSRDNSRERELPPSLPAWHQGGRSASDVHQQGEGGIHQRGGAPRGIGSEGVALRLIAGNAPSRDVDSPLHLSVLQQLVGEEVRQLVRGEIRSALADHMSAGPSPNPCKEERACTPQLTRAASALKSRSMLGDELRPSRTLSLNCQQEINDESGSEVSVGLELEDSSAKHTLLATNDALAKPISQMALIAEVCPGFKEAVLRAGDLCNTLGSDEAPERTDCLSRVHDSAWFQLVVHTVIVLNAVMMSYAANEEITIATKGTEHFPAYYVEVCFLCFYSLEFLVRLARYREHYFYGSGWLSNWLDLFILAGTFLSFSIRKLQNLSWLRISRTLRVLKALRLLRLMVMFRTLRAILLTIEKTFMDLFWSAVMFLIVLYMFSLIFVINTATYISEKELSEKDQKPLLDKFGSVSVAMLSLFWPSIGGSEWIELWELLSPTGMFSRGLLLFLVAFMHLALLNMILGIFADHAIGNLNSSREERTLQHARDEEEIENDLRSLCFQADTSGNGYISTEEFKAAINNGDMRHYLHMVGLRPHDLQTYFDILMFESQDGRVKIDTLVNGCMRLRGSASSFHIDSTLFEVIQVKKKLKGIKNQQDAIRSLLEGQPRA